MFRSLVLFVQFLFFVQFSCRAIKNGGSQEGSVCNTEGNVVTLSDTCSSPSREVSRGLFRNDINSTGWAYLEVETFDIVADEVQAYAAGVIEGHLTRELIDWHWKNTVAGYCAGVGEYCNRLDNYLVTNLNWMKTQISSSVDDSYWHQVKLMLIQLAGLEDGFYKTPTKPHMNITSFGFLLFQLSGDFEDLEQALKKPEHLRKPLFSRDSCSALVVPLAKNQDILFAHVTWSAYQTMLRIQKLYKFPYAMTSKGSEIVSSTVITFSSYPGTLLSIDDFYLLSSGLAVTETTIGNSNSSLLPFIKPHGTVLSWIRVMVANRLSNSGQRWVDIFRKRNSGTYNNQFMVLDYKKFTPGKPLPKSGLFFVLEQIPGMVKYMDMTGFIAKQGYWPSYNVPYFPEIFNASGNLDNVKKYGDWFTYDKTPRALIFNRDWSNVKDMSSLTKLMRYNNYQKDPLSSCNCTPPYSAENAISARNDLNPANGTFPFRQLGHRSHGGTDLKATSYKLIQKLQFLAISGPTYDDVPAFQWSNTDFAASTPHFGHPDVFKFGPVINEWSKL